MTGETLAAVATLLEGPVREEVQDKGLAFKVRLAAGLLRSLARELERPSLAAEQEQILEEIRQGRTEGLAARVMELLKAELDPAFDTSLEVE